MSFIGVQCLIGIQCKDFVMIASDQIHFQSFFIIKDDQEKTLKISDNMILGMSGEQSQCHAMNQYICKNFELYKLRNGYSLGVAAVAHFIRNSLVNSLHSELNNVTTDNPTNLLFAGCDDKDGAQLYYMDFLGSCLRLPYACHGLGGLISISILDKLYRPDLTDAQAYDVVKKCIKEVHKRFMINLPNFEVTLVNNNGVFSLPPLTKL